MCCSHHGGTQQDGTDMMDSNAEASSRQECPASSMRGCVNGIGRQGSRDSLSTSRGDSSAQIVHSQLERLAPLPLFAGRALFRWRFYLEKSRLFN